MLPKPQRLPHSLRISSGRSLRTEFFLVKTVPSSLNSSRFGIVISKKIDKRAVARNRMRRLLQQAIQTHWLTLTPTRDTLFIVQKSFTELSEPLVEQVTSFLQKA